jgi:hypothetical protein
MSDAGRLLGWFADGSLVRPDASVPGTVHLSHALAMLAGADGIEMEPPAARIANAIGEAEHYVFVLVDGLGMNLIDALPEESFLRRHVAMELQSVFPSSTAPALTALFTGCWPAEHAVTGWFMYLPDAGITSTILPFIERFSERPLGELGITSESAYRAPSLLPRLRGAASWVPAPIAGSVTSRYFTGGTPTSGYERLGDACDAIASRVAGSAPPTYTYLYISSVDKTQHEDGPDSEQAQAALAEVDRALAALGDGLGGRARLVVSADHGQIGVAEAAQSPMHADDPLLHWLLVPPTGDFRAPLFHAKAGAGASFAAAFRERFGASWALLTIDEADELRLLGPQPLATETRRRLGDFIALGPGADAIRYAPDEPMLGYHGGLRREETRIPLILA